jgi:uncharacterized membrane protein YfbV (UPF0208 family)
MVFSNKQMLYVWFYQITMIVKLVICDNGRSVMVITNKPTYQERKRPKVKQISLQTGPIVICVPV